MEAHKRLLLGNKAWAEEKLTLDKNFFTDHEKGQKPEFLWIGCSDSRVPAEEVTGTQPGEIFVHRNIANLVVHTDFNLLSVLSYAVEVLKVEHVIVCGHYGCGGVASALTNESYGILNKWLRNIKDVYRFYRNELDELTDPQETHDRLVELNVIEQVHNLAETTIIQNAWHNDKRPMLHGWVYDLGTGVLKPIKKMDAGTKIEPIYMYDFSNKLPMG